MDQDRFNKMMNILSLIYEKRNEPHTGFLLKIGDEVSGLLEELLSIFWAMEVEVLTESRAEDYFSYISSIQRILDDEDMFQWLLEQNRTIWCGDKMASISQNLANTTLFGLEDPTQQNYGPDGFDKFRTTPFKHKELKVREILSFHRKRLT